MPVYSWQERPTTHFGSVWVPFAQINLRDSAGAFRSISMQIDSGATISLLRRSVGQLLGLQLESGRRIELTGVGGARTAVFVHEITARFEDDSPFIAPFAIADSEQVPNLLGRLSVFDRFQITFDPTRKETRVKVP